MNPGRVTLALMAWIVIWAVLEALHDQWKRKRDKYADLNEGR